MYVFKQINPDNSITLLPFVSLNQLSTDVKQTADAAKRLGFLKFEFERGVAGTSVFAVYKEKRKIFIGLILGGKYAVN